MKYEARAMQGRLANGNEADHGTLVHAVVRKRVKARPCPWNDWGRDPEKQFTEAPVALCGKRPGRRSVGWSAPEETQVTCARCLAKLEPRARA